MKQYPEYKDSGVEWLGDIPFHWKINKFGRVSYMKGRIGWQGLKQSEFIDDPTLPYLITGMNFKNGVINWDEVYHISEERYAEAPEIQLHEDDILMTKDGTIGKLLHVDHLPNKTSLNSHLLVLRPLNGGYIPRFIYYELQSDYFKHHIEKAKVGTTFYGITQEGTGQFMVLLPPNTEQSQIATFLDHKTRQIDDLIAKKQKLIELLKEERTALINQAVTKGLDPTVPMKDSGIEWLGLIPKHWKVKKIKYTGALKSGEGITSELISTEGEHPVYGGNGIRGYYSSYTHDGNYILIGRQGALCGNINYAYGKFWASEHAVVASLVDKTNITWFGELLRSMNLNSYSQSAAQPGLAVEMIKNMRIPVPPFEEQSDIGSFIQENTIRIEGMINLISKEIALINEYKTSLINEAVTGKIDVRDYQINHA
jgi:type I restriction enzyme S subunit